jgi:hypothetical protein
MGKTFETMQVSSFFSNFYLSVTMICANDDFLSLIPLNFVAGLVL